MTSISLADSRSRGMTRQEQKLIFASSLGTVFEWYDFYLCGSLAAIISQQFFSGVNETAAFIFALLAFAAGFAVRPFGALFFGRIGDIVGRKYTFLITILLMGTSTFLVGVLPALFVFYIRRYVPEPEVYTASSQARERGGNFLAIFKPPLLGRVIGATLAS